MPLIPFPNVPKVPGVPVIFRSLSVPTPESLAISALGALTDLLGLSTQWGVYDQDGSKALSPDTFLAVDYKNNSRVSSYPQEQGAFASYNKVQTPYDVRVRMAIGADLATRTAFLARCEAMLKSLDTFTVITPEATYQSATLENYEYRRETRDGTTLITVDLWFLEIRVAPAAQYSTPPGGTSASAGAATTLRSDQVKSASTASPVSGGQVNPAKLDSSQFKIMEIR
ncbi:MAG: hypothetical protein VB141_11690 [Burkholderia gladioli]